MNPTINPVEALYIQVQFAATLMRIFIVNFPKLIIHVHEIKKKRVFKKKVQ